MKYVQLLMVLMLLPVVFAGNITLDTFEDLSIDEDSELTSTIEFSSDTGTPVYSVVIDSISCGDCLAQTLIAGDFTDNFDGTVDLTWTPTNDDVGEHTINITFSDGVDDDGDGILDNTTGSLNITVSNVNDAPSIILSSVTESVAEDAAMATITITTADDDLLLTEPDTIVLSYEFDVEPSTEVTFTDNGDGTGELDWTPVNADVGSYEVNITATDSAGEESSDVLSITVTNENDDPVIDAVDDQEVFANPAAGDYATLEVVFNATDEDIDNGEETTLSYSVSHAFTGTSSVDDDTWTFTPAEADVGTTETVTVTVTDEAGLTDSTTFDVTVSENFSPVFDEDVDIVETTIEQDESITISYSVSDEDGDTLSYSVDESFDADYTVGESTLSSATFDENGMDWTPGALDVGVHTFTIIVSDGSYETESSEVVITVTDVDDDPIVEEIDDIEAEVGDDLEIEIVVYDPEDSEITVTTWDVDCDDSGCDSTLDVDLDDALDDFLDESSNGYTLVWEPESDDVGTHEVRIVFEDENGNAVTIRFDIEIDEVSTEYDDNVEDIEDSLDDYQDDLEDLKDDYCDAEDDGDDDELDDIIDDLDDLDDDLSDLDDVLDDLQDDIDDDSDIDEDVADDLIDDLEDLEDDIADLRSDISDVIDDGASCSSSSSTYTSSSDSTSATTYTSSTSSDDDDDDDTSSTESTVTVTTVPATSTTTSSATSTEQNFGDFRVIVYMSAAIVIILAMMLFMITLLFAGKKRN